MNTVSCGRVLPLRRRRPHHQSMAFCCGRCGRACSTTRQPLRGPEALLLWRRFSRLGRHKALWVCLSISKPRGPTTTIQWSLTDALCKGKKSHTTQPLHMHNLNRAWYEIVQHYRRHLWVHTWMAEMIHEPAGIHELTIDET